MSNSAQKICIEVLSLPLEARAEIAERLLASLEDRRDDKAEKSWKALVRRRREEVRVGKTKLRRSDDVMRDALNALQ